MYVFILRQMKYPEQRRAIKTAQRSGQVRTDSESVKASGFSSATVLSPSSTPSLILYAAITVPAATPPAATVCHGTLRTTSRVFTDRCRRGRCTRWGAAEAMIERAERIAARMSFIPEPPFCLPCGNCRWIAAVPRSTLNEVETLPARDRRHTTLYRQ